MIQSTTSRHRPKTDCAKAEIWGCGDKERIRRSGSRVFGFLPASGVE
nr:MAG TPA: hypothetical protein [Caudoviricetes sp.]